MGLTCRIFRAAVGALKMRDEWHREELTAKMKPRQMISAALARWMLGADSPNA